MLIACLGWGSLVWDPCHLPVRGEWFRDGPFLPIEYARKSSNGRMTLVLVPDTFSLLPSLWAKMSVTSIKNAREALRKREDVPKKNADKHIAHWSKDNWTQDINQRVGSWAERQGLDAVVWTNLPPKFNDKEVVPSVEEIVTHLNLLPHEKRKNAEHYVRMTPRQINTEYRRVIEARLGWTPTGHV